MNATVCALCTAHSENLMWRDDTLRIILVDDASYGGYCRVILHRHVQEMTDLATEERSHVMRVVFVVEQVLRDLMQPDKINLASLGNQVPHLHWHVIPRFADDAHFPDPIWAVARRNTRARALDVDALRSAIERKFSAS